uniref:Uncharacterized protein n=1 Tax=Hordeum vulgare subsp. vulgare TaxID=112509 RepID=A0A8I6XQ72_HORVV
MVTAGAGYGGRDDFGRRGGLRYDEDVDDRGRGVGRKCHNDGEAGRSVLRPLVSERQREATATGNVTVAARLLALGEEFDLQATLCSTLMDHTLHCDEPLPHDGIDSANDGDFGNKEVYVF